MVQGDALPVAPGVSIPRAEIRIEFTRSGGPGGQRVNKAETCAIVRFRPGASSALAERQKALVAEREAESGQPVTEEELERARALWPD